MVNLICKKMRKNKSSEMIADELETTVDEIQKICIIAGKYALEYDAKEVFQEFWEKEKAEKGNF